MAVDLPPVMPPQLVNINTMNAYYKQRSSPVLVGTIGQFSVEVIGYMYLDKDDIQQLMEAASTPSQFILALNNAYYRNGNLLMQLFYVQRDSTVYVYVAQKRLQSIEGPESIVGHFSDLKGEKDLTVAEYDKHRVLAQLKSSRQGIDYSVAYQQGNDPSSIIMVLTGTPAEDHSPGAVYLDVGNQGNRFVGRYFGGAGVSYHNDSGTEMKLDYETALIELDDADGGKSYHGGVLNINHPSSAGLYGIEALYSTYEREITTSIERRGLPFGEDVAPVCVIPGSELCTSSLPEQLQSTTTEVTLFDLKATSAAVALTGEQVLFSSPRHRMTFAQRLEWLDDSIEDRDQGTLLDEAYGVLGLGVKYLINARPFGANSQTSLHVFAKGGISEDSGTLGTDTSPDIVAIGKRTAEFVAVLPKFSTYLDLGRHVRVSIDASGQFSDGNQLPQMQQYILGGISLISAYLPGVLTGDAGTYVRAAFSGIYFGPDGAKFTPSIFIENGRAWFEDTNGSHADVRSITDAGVRLTIELGDAVHVELAAAHSMNEKNIPQDVLDDYAADFFGRMRVRF